MLVARRVAEPPPAAAADQKFAVLRRAARVWVVAAIHGDATRLSALHQRLGERFAAGDRLVYTGNYFGHGAAINLDDPSRPGEGKMPAWPKVLSLAGIGVALSLLGGRWLATRSGHRRPPGTG